ncbi:MAG TPA: copper resistance CopC family protein [Candidatus Binatia bacterium]
MIVSLVIALFLVFCTPSWLFAHAYLVKSLPAQRAVLHRRPSKIQLWFNERLEPRYSSLSVVRDDGKAVEMEPSAVDPNDAKLLAATLKPLAPGRYRVAFRVLSVDGHVVQDQFSFTIKP